MRYVVSPNLPQNPVRVVLLGQDAAEIEGGAITRHLEKQSIHAILVPRCKELSRPLASHPDMLCHHLGGDKILVYRGIADVLAPQLEKYGFSIAVSRRTLKPRYPDDVALNAAVLGSTALFRNGHIDEQLLSFFRLKSMKTVDVRQGYAKCSVFIVDEKSLITSDPSIRKKAAEIGFDVLFIEKAHIGLPGLDYGFIGGCGGLLSKKTACFAGEIETHPDYKRIHDFLAARGIKPVSLCSGPLNDIGGILPIMENE